MAHNFRQFNDSPNQLVPGTPWLPIPFCGSPAAEVPEIRSQIISSELSGFDFDRTSPLSPHTRNGTVHRPFTDRGEIGEGHSVSTQLTISVGAENNIEQIVPATPCADNAVSSGMASLTSSVKAADSPKAEMTSSIKAENSRVDRDCNKSRARKQLQRWRAMRFLSCSTTEQDKVNRQFCLFGGPNEDIFFK